MSAKKLIIHLYSLHKSDDDLLTDNRILTELYVAQHDSDCRQVRKAISIMENRINNKLKKEK